MEWNHRNVVSECYWAGWERDCKWSHSPFGVDAMMYALHSEQYWSFRNNCHFQNGAIEIDSWYFIVSTHKMHREQSHQIHLYIYIFGLHATHSVIAIYLCASITGQNKGRTQRRTHCRLLKENVRFCFPIPVNSLLTLMRTRPLVNLLTCLCFWMQL